MNRGARQKVVCGSCLEANAEAFVKKTENDVWNLDREGDARAAQKKNKRNEKRKEKAKRKRAELQQQMKSEQHACGACNR